MEWGCCQVKLLTKKLEQLLVIEIRNIPEIRRSVFAVPSSSDSVSVNTTSLTEIRNVPLSEWSWSSITSNCSSWETNIVTSAGFLVLDVSTKVTLPFATNIICGCFARSNFRDKKDNHVRDKTESRLSRP